MKLFVSLKKLIKRIDKIDKKTKKMFEKKIYSTNPIAFDKKQTLIWVDEVKDYNKCQSYKTKNKNKEDN